MDNEGCPDISGKASEGTLSHSSRPGPKATLGNLPPASAGRWRHSSRLLPTSLQGLGAYVALNTLSCVFASVLPLNRDALGSTGPLCTHLSTSQCLTETARHPETLGKLCTSPQKKRVSPALCSEIPFPFSLLKRVSLITKATSKADASYA